MSQEPIEPEEIEYLEPMPEEHPSGTQTFVYTNTGVPCCSGCGCMALALGIILVILPNALISALLVILASAWLAASLLRLSGVHRFSPVYVYLLVPLFLTTANFLAKLVRGFYPFGWTEIVVGTLLIYAFLLAIGKAAGRRYMPF